MNPIRCPQCYLPWSQEYAGKPCLACSAILPSDGAESNAAARALFDAKHSAEHWEESHAIERARAEAAEAELSALLSRGHLTTGLRFGGSVGRLRSIARSAPLLGDVLMKAEDARRVIVSLDEATARTDTAEAECRRLKRENSGFRQELDTLSSLDEIDSLQSIKSIAARVEHERNDARTETAVLAAAVRTYLTAEAGCVEGDAESGNVLLAAHAALTTVLAGCR